jgi:hypothetical protein
MTTATLEGKLSASVSSLANLSSVKSEVWKLFEAERERINPQDIVVINDGEVFHVNTERDYDQWSLATTKYVLERSNQGKVVTISVFVA